MILFLFWISDESPDDLDQTKTVTLQQEKDEAGAPEKQNEDDLHVKVLEAELLNQPNILHQETMTLSEIHESKAHEDHILEDLDFILKLLKNKDVDAETLNDSVKLRLQKYSKD